MMETLREIFILAFLLCIPILAAWIIFIWSVTFIPFLERQKNARDINDRISNFLLYLFSPLAFPSGAIIDLTAHISRPLLIIFAILLFPVWLPIFVISAVFIFRQEILHWLKTHVGPLGNKILNYEEGLPQRVSDKTRESKTNLGEVCLSWLSNGQLIQWVGNPRLQQVLSYFGLSEKAAKRLHSIILTAGSSTPLKLRAIKDLEALDRSSELLDLLRIRSLEPLLALRAARSLSRLDFHREPWHRLGNNQDARLAIQGAKRLITIDPNRAYAILRALANKPRVSSQIQVKAIAAMPRLLDEQAMHNHLLSLVNLCTEHAVCLPGAVLLARRGRMDSAIPIIFSFLEPGKSRQEHHAAITALQRLNLNQKLQSTAYNLNLGPEDWQDAALAFERCSPPAQAISTWLYLALQSKAPPSLKVTALLAIGRLSQSHSYRPGNDERERCLIILSDIAKNETNDPAVRFSASQVLEKFNEPKTAYIFYSILASRQTPDRAIRRQAQQARIRLHL